MVCQPIIIHSLVKIMADEKRIVIEIIGGEARSSSVQSSSSQSFGTTSEMSSSENISGSSSNWGTYAKMGAVAALDIARVVGVQAESQIEMYFQLTEDYKTQQDVANAKSTINHVVGAFAQVGGGAAVGMMAGGPFGAVVGAVAGATKWTVQTFFNAKKIQFEQNLDISTKGYTVEYNRNLAGLLTGESRNTEN